MRPVPSSPPAVRHVVFLPRRRAGAAAARRPPAAPSPPGRGAAGPAGVPRRRGGPLLGGALRRRPRAAGAHTSSRAARGWRSGSPWPTSTACCASTTGPASCYQAALALEPLSAEAHLFYGIHLLSQAEADGAAQELSRALFLDPDLALAHYYLGRSREAQRDPQRARLAYRNTIEALKRLPSGKRQAFLGYYPDIPEDGAAFARAAEYALAAL